MNQLELHKKIDALLTKDPSEIGSKDVSVLISANSDAHHYFFAKADERWLDWLWDNRFLDVIKQKAENPTRYGYRTSELNYLVKVAEKEPAEAVNIMLKVPISKENFNPEVIDRFLSICSILSATELKRIVGKIYEDGWVPLMGVFNDWGFDYEKMFKTLADANDFDSLFILTKAVLSVRPKKEAAQENRRFLFDSPFYFKDLSYTKVFEYLLKVNEESAGNALDLATNIMKQVILFGEKEGKSEVFEVYDTLSLYDVDFFDLKLSEHDRLSQRDDIKKLAAVITELARRTIGSHSIDPSRLKELYKKYFESLPDSRSMWRLKLFVLTFNAECFKDELKNAFFRLFGVEHYYNEVISCTEYLKSLHAGFPVLSDSDKRNYVKQVVEYFVKKDQGKENENEDWHLKNGSKILSVIASELTDKEKEVAKDTGFTLNPDYEIEPIMGQMRGGTVVPRGPITKEEFEKLSIVVIAKKLRHEWAPKKLSAQNKNEDFLNPLNAEGAGELMRSDIPKRPQEYINNANLFFERDVLDQHYTYSFFRGIQEAIKNVKDDARGIKWDGLASLCLAIKKSGEDKSFDTNIRERDSFDAWLSGWTGVHSAIADVLQELLNEEAGNILIDFSKYRRELFGIISYLLSYPDPIPADEETGTALSTISHGGKEQTISDPFTIAINTVRGRAFQAFISFVFQDGKRFTKEATIKISDDVEGLYELVLRKENTRALMFMFGHYLPSFFFRDKDWIQKLLPLIFPTDETKKKLYTAAWEGYITTNLYEEMFFNAEIQKLYERGFTLTEDDFPNQEHFKEPDEGIAVHLALAFVHFSKFTSDHELFNKFWNTTKKESKKTFISFIGRYVLSRESAPEYLKANNIDIEKLKGFWDWALQKDDFVPEIFEGFGFWINPSKEILPYSWLVERLIKTLERSNGQIDWDYGLIQQLSNLANAAPEHTLKIVRCYLLDEDKSNPQSRSWVYVDRELKTALEILYKNDKVKDAVKQLINDLLPIGSGRFWGLKEIL